MNKPLSPLKAILTSLLLAIVLSAVCGLLIVVFSPLNNSSNRTAVFTIFRDIAETQSSEAMAVRILEQLPYDRSAGLNFWFASREKGVVEAGAAGELPPDVVRFVGQLQPSIQKAIFGNMRGPFGRFYVVLKSPKFGDYLVIRESKKGPLYSVRHQIARFALFTIAATMFISFFILLLLVQKQSGQFIQLLDMLSAGHTRSKFAGTWLDRLISNNRSFKQIAERTQTLVSSLKDAEFQRASFVEQVAHDIRTPLTSLRTSAETISLQPNLDAQSRATLTSIILDDIHFLSRLTDNLLAISDLDRKIVTSEIVDVGRLVRSLFEKYKNSQVFGQRKIDWVLEFTSEDPLHVTADETQLQRLLVNLIDNAIDFTKSRIVIGAQRDGDQIHLFVADDGPGLSELARKHYGTRSASRFTNVLHHDQRRSSLGIGSVIVVETARMFDGEVNLKQKDDAGLCVEIIFKAA